MISSIKVAIQQYTPRYFSLTSSSNNNNNSITNSTNQPKLSTTNLIQPTQQQTMLFPTYPVKETTGMQPRDQHQNTGSQQGSIRNTQ